MRWYVLHVSTGKEKNVAEELKRLGMHALVPTVKKLHQSSGTWSEKEYVLFDSYVFLEADFTAETWYKVNGLQHVIRWLGDKKCPSYLTYMEAEWIRILANGGESINPSHIILKQDGTYTVKDGVLSLFKSKIKSINKRQKTARIQITVCDEIKEIVLSIEIETENDLASISSASKNEVEKNNLSDESAI